MLRIASGLWMQHVPAGGRHRPAGQAAEADRARIDSRNSFESYNDTRGRLAQNFTNLLRDESVVLDGSSNTHSTEWNSVADQMVKNDPNRYSIVENRGYWKGVDY